MLRPQSGLLLDNIMSEHAYQPISVYNPKLSLLILTLNELADY